MTRATLPFEFNGIEIVAVLLAACGLAGLARMWGWPRRDCLVALALVIPVLLLTAAEATQFLTMDEWGISIQMLDPLDRAQKQLALGAFRSGIIPQLGLARVLQGVGVQDD